MKQKNSSIVVYINSQGKRFKDTVNLSPDEVIEYAKDKVRQGYKTVYIDNNGTMVRIHSKS